MTRRRAAHPPHLTRLARLAVWAGFTCLVVRFAWNQPAWDLTASYVAGRLAATHQYGAIYHQVVADPHPVSNPIWLALARQGGIADGMVTPYVQTPLWAWMVAPLATGMQFSVFKRIFAATLALSTLVITDQSARTWAPSLRAPGSQAALLAAVLLTVPFQQSVILGQTHLMFLCLTLVAIIACRSGREWRAGALLAAAAAVKITPSWVALTWLVSGRWRAAASFAAWLAVLTALASQVGGHAVFAEYLAQLHRFARSVLLSFNNDSLATVLLGSRLTEATAFRFEQVALPGWVSAVSVLAVAVCATLAGWLDRQSRSPPNRGLGALLTLVAATICAPLAWNHYFVVLLIPAMVFLQTARAVANPAWAGLSAAVLLLCAWPLAYTIGAPLAKVAWRSEFWAALLCVAGLALLAIRASFQARESPLPWAP